MITMLDASRCATPARTTLPMAWGAATDRAAVHAAHAARAADAHRPRGEPDRAAGGGRHRRAAVRAPPGHARARARAAPARAAVAAAAAPVLVPLQYTRRVPAEVPTIEQAIERLCRGRSSSWRGTYHLRAPLLIKQIRIRGEGAANECPPLRRRTASSSAPAATRSSPGLDQLPPDVGRDAPSAAARALRAPLARACAAPTRGSRSTCEVISTAVGVIAAPGASTCSTRVLVPLCGVFLASAEACLEENTVENNGGAGVVIDASTTEARRNTVCHNTAPASRSSASAPAASSTTR